MPETKTRLKLAEFEERARAARDSWIKEMLKGTRIEDRVKKQLGATMDSMIWYVIGLEKRWDNEWSLSRTNGREPAIYHAISEAVEERAVELVMAALAEGGLPKLGKAQRDSIRKAYLDKLAYKARDLASDEGAHDAQDALDRILAEVDDGDAMSFCPACNVRHLDPLHDPDTKETQT